MKKINYLLIAIFAVVLLLYSLILFAVKNNFDTVSWFAYGFTVFSFVSTVVLIIILNNSSRSMDDVFINGPIILVNTIYLLVQIIVGIIIMAVPLFSLKIANIIQISILLLTAIIDLICMIGKSTAK